MCSSILLLPGIASLVTRRKALVIRIYLTQRTAFRLYPDDLVTISLKVQSVSFKAGGAFTWVILVMKAIVQRCLSASVTVDSKIVSSIGKGVLVLAAIGPYDDRKTVESMAAKVLKMKLWPNEAGAPWKSSVQDLQGEVLCVSQFTLYASTKKGNKPDFHAAAKPEVAKELYDHFLSTIRKLYQPDKVGDGVFQAMMEVALVNDGPVTLQMDNDPRKDTPASTSGTATPTTSSSVTSGRNNDVE